MNSTTNEKIIAYLTLVTGLALSVVAEYYSIAGLTAIFAAAVIPTIIMGITLGLGKVMATIWVKQNWDTAPWSIKIYLCAAIVVLMLITSMGTFGFLSKAHSDQNLVSGDVQAKIAIYDEKIKTEKENIETNRKALKQMDEGVDQVLGRSTSETGADKAVALRRSQQKERVRLQNEISQSQKSISELNDARAPIAAEVRKIEAEVGPIKYLAAFVYGETSEGVLERAVTWVIVLIIFVFDPLALMLLIASQISFQKLRNREQDELLLHKTVPHHDIPVHEIETATEEDLTDNLFPTYEEITPTTEGDSPVRVNDDVIALQPTVTTSTGIVAELIPEGVITPPTPIVSKEESRVVRTKVFARPDGYVQNEEQNESNLWAKTVQKMDLNDPEILNNIAKSKAEE